MSDEHELWVVRHRTVADEAELVKPLNQLVHALLAEDPALFQLFGYSPAFHLHPVVDGNKSLVENFLMTSEIQWHHGRSPEDPTHQVVYFGTSEEPGLSVYLRVQFVVEGTEATCPGLVAQLRLGTGTLVHAGADRTARLDRLFSMLIESLRPDFGHVQLPGHPEASGWPNAPDVGWLTYLADAERAGSPNIAPPSVAIPFTDGVKIQAAPAPAPEDYTVIADAISALRLALR